MRSAANAAAAASASASASVSSSGETAAAAAAAATTKSKTTAGEDLRAALQALRPPLVGLRCGHALHLECAEASVRSARGRHVRCPLCREPATLRGAVAARAFS